MTDTEKEPKEDGSSEEANNNQTSDTEDKESESSKSSGAARKSDEDDDSEDDESEDGDDSDEEEEEDSEEQDSKENNKSASSESSKSTSPLLVGVLCLAAGFGIGWFGQQFQINKAVKTADAAVQGEGEGARGPCKEWEKKLCSEFSETAFACTQAKSAAPLLSGSACEQAMKSVDKTIATVKAARASCTTLTDKLCGELGAEAQTCELVKTQTPSFPPEKCDEMMKNYDQVLQQLKMMEQRGMGGPPPGHPGARPPGAPGGPPGSGPPPGAVRVSPAGPGPGTPPPAP